MDKKTQPDDISGQLPGTGGDYRPRYPNATGDEGDVEGHRN